jgi:hypothetical protein
MMTQDNARQRNGGGKVWQIDMLMKRFATAGCIPLEFGEEPSIQRARTET